MRLKPLLSRIAWEGKWRLRVDTFHLPDGSDFEKATVEHPGAVVLVPIMPGDSGPNVLMLRQYRLALDETILELPAGTREGAEDWLVCAGRELREETGYGARRFTSLGDIWPAPGLSNERMAIFLAEDLYADPLPADIDEEIVVEQWSLADLTRMALDGRLQDAKSVVALLRAAGRLSPD